MSTSVFIAPAGLFRVLSCEMSNPTGILIQDCDTLEEAFQITDNHNRKPDRIEIYYVYDDQGKYLRGIAELSQ